MDEGQWEQLVQSLDEKEPSQLVSAAPEQEPAAPQKKRSLVSTLSGILFYVVIFGIVFTVFISTGKSGGAPRNILGYSYFTVLTGSMQKEIPKGSFILTKRTAPEELQVGDNITFFKDANTTITHKIVGIYEDYNPSGERGFQTKGVNNQNPDKEIVSASNVIGKVIFTTPKVGIWMSILSENLIFVFFMLGMMFLLSFSLNMYFRIRKQEKKQGS